MIFRAIQRLSTLAALATIATLGLAHPAHADLTFNFAGSPATGAGTGATINFTGTGSGASFTLAPNNAANDFTITSTTGGTGSANMLQGNISGTYAYTSVTVGPAGLQTANLSGNGTLTILNPGGTNLTANVTGVNIYTLGTTGGQNAGGSINLSNVTGGTGNADLVSFVNQAAANGGVETLSFQFVPAMSLTALESGTHNTSFSGTLAATATPEPGTIALATTALPLLGLGAWARRRRS
jgi:hypothetical protein